MIPDWSPTCRRHGGHSPRHRRLKKIIGCSRIFSNVHQNQFHLNGKMVMVIRRLFCCSPSCSFSSFSKFCLSVTLIVAIATLLLRSYCRFFGCKIARNDPITQAITEMALKDNADFGLYIYRADPEKSVPVWSIAKCVIKLKFSKVKHFWITNKLT